MAVHWPLLRRQRQPAQILSSCSRRLQLPQHQSCQESQLTCPTARWSLSHPPCPQDWAGMQSHLSPQVWAGVGQRQVPQQLTAVEQPMPFHLEASLSPPALLWVLIHLCSGPRALQGWCQGLVPQVLFSTFRVNTGTEQSWIPGFGKPMADDPLQQHDQASLDLPRVVHISNVNAASVIVPIEACFLCAGDTTMGLPGDVLPNGMPALPADLQLDAPLTVPKEASKFAAPQATAEGSGFQGGLFTMPTQQTNSMWQQFGQQQATQQRAPTGLPQPQRDQSNPNLALASKGAWGAPAAGLSPMSQTQLNAFSSGPSNPTGGPPGLQFGQVISGGFGAFVPTGMCRSHVQIACRPIHLSKHL